MNQCLESCLIEFFDNSTQGFHRRRCYCVKARGHKERDAHNEHAIWIGEELARLTDLPVNTWFYFPEEPKSR